MADNVADKLKVPAWSPPGISGTKTVRMRGVAVLTTSGAVGSTARSHAGVTPAKPAGTGVYTFTFPVSKAIDAWVGLYDVSGVADSVRVVTAVASTGVVTVQLDTSGSAADGTSGDTIVCWADLEFD